MSKQIDHSLPKEARLPVFCPVCSKIVMIECCIFGVAGPREIAYFADILLSAHNEKEHGDGGN